MLLIHLILVQLKNVKHGILNVHLNLVLDVLQLKNVINIQLQLNVKLIFMIKDVLGMELFVNKKNVVNILGYQQLIMIVIIILLLVQ